MCIADIIIVIRYNFIIPTKQMQLFTVYATRQFDVLIQVYKKRAMTRLNHLATLSETSFSRIEETFCQGQGLKNTQWKKKTETMCLPRTHPDGMLTV
uniref:Macaca fascicularis brain cDNA clone: QtrA-17140, similar to human likely ortholog of mouse ubiquitin conjugating enzyme 7interacting protein 5 (UBCE7IP5), transcript variant 2, mRNA, RefSeq: NM_19... n=1 Tax=Macaca fascicularis TaxID=9541 RepID=I7GM22_MACFA|nr:unnamed protein product [Macaca fascicularis]